MWRWLNPVECSIAERLIAERQFLRAARVLLESPNREHRAVRDVRTKLASLLAKQARMAFESGQQELAEELIACCAECAELSAEVQDLHERIQDAGNRQRRQQLWDEQRLKQAEDWAAQGRLQSAMQLVEPVQAEMADMFRADLEFDRQRLCRYVTEFHGYVEQKQFGAAKAVLEKARQLAPGQPVVKCLEQTLQEAVPTCMPEVDSEERSAGDIAERSSQDARRADRPIADASTPLRTDIRADSERSIAFNNLQAGQRGQEQVLPSATRERQHCVEFQERCVVSGLATFGDVLVVARPVITIGSFASEWVDVPMQALINPRHALLVRDAVATKPDSWRIVPLSGSRVQVNSQPVADSRRLEHGDVIQLAGEQCRWSFRLPVNGSATAILEQVRPAIATVRTVEVGSIRTVVRCIAGR